MLYPRTMNIAAEVEHIEEEMVWRRGTDLGR
jgi:hypothetical protein